jgi:ECF sigma factor
MSETTQLLNAIEAGDPQASAQLLPLVYDELRRLAAQALEQVASDVLPVLLAALEDTSVDACCWASTQLGDLVLEVKSAVPLLAQMPRRVNQGFARR